MSSCNLTHLFDEGRNIKNGGYALIDGVWYKNVQELGSGAFGSVYKLVPCQSNGGQPTDLDHDNAIALKVQIQRRGTVEAAFKEKNLIRRLTKTKLKMDTMKFKGKILSPLPLLGDQNLGQMKDNETLDQLSLTEKFDFINEICTQITELHSRTNKSIVGDNFAQEGYYDGKIYVHKDLKLENIQVSEKYKGIKLPHVIDFGISQEEGSDPQGDVSPGTIFTVAPEVFDGKNATVKSDIYSLGVVFTSIFDSETSQKREEEIMSQGSYAWIFQHDVMKKPIYGKSNQSINDFSSLENSPKILSQRQLKKIMADFINLMAHQDPSRRPNIIQVSRFFSKMKQLSVSLDVLSANPNSVEKILEAKKMTRQSLNMTYQSIPTAEKIFLFKSLLKRNKKKFLNSYKKFKHKKIYFFGSSLYKAILQNKIDKWIGRHQDFFSSESLVNALADIEYFKMNQYQLKEVKAIARSVKPKDTEGFPRQSNISKTDVTEHDLNSYKDFCLGDLKINALQLLLMSKGKCWDKDYQRNTESVDQNRAELLALCEMPHLARDVERITSDHEELVNNHETVNASEVNSEFKKHTLDAISEAKSQKHNIPLESIHNESKVERKRGKAG